MGVKRGVPNKSDPAGLTRRARLHYMGAETAASSWPLKGALNVTPPMSLTPEMGEPQDNPLVKDLDDAPDFLPEAGPVDRKVFLPLEAWEELRVAAKFEDDAYKLAKLGSVSRNDLIAYLVVTWGLPNFWKKRGGKPDVGSPEWAERVAAEAERLKAADKERKAKAASALKDSADK